MTAQKPIDVSLTCFSWQEAQRITDSLLQKNLVSVIESFDVDRKINSDNGQGKEIKLIMRSAIELFDELQTEVGKLLNRENYNLELLPIGAYSFETIDTLNGDTN